jgi:bla regulator protein blaR1
MGWLSFTWFGRFTMSHRIRWLVAAALALALGTVAQSADAGSKSRRSTTTSNQWQFGDDFERFAYVLVRPATRSQTGSGNSEDFQEASELRDRYRSDFLYLRRDRDRYVIHDPAVMRRVDDIIEPQELLGRQQGLLGRQQGRLGREQARLGREQGELGARQGRLGTEQGRLGTEMARRVAGGEDTDDLSRRMEAIGREQDALGARQSEIGLHQERLGREQEQLGQRQSALGAQQAKVAREIQAQLAVLLDQSLETGIAEPLG